MKCGTKVGQAKVGQASRLPKQARSASHVFLAAFTMIEIAISLAIIGFALVAIIGILPIGMNAQKENRQETIINQDETVWMNGLRNGERGLDDLTNYVLAITNYRTRYDGTKPTAETVGYTFKDSSTSPKFPITNGFRIMGLLTTPEIIVPTNTASKGGQNLTYFSNHVVAFVRSLSGPASEKFPQTNSSVQDLALSYRMIVAVGSYTNFFNPAWTNWADPTITTNEVTVRSNYAILVRNYEANLHDIRLTFRWPLLPNGDGGPGRQIYRTMAGGIIQPFLEPGYPDSPDFWLYFFRPRTYVRVP